MIKSKQDLKFYLECDKMALKYTRKRPLIIGSDVWKYQILLRKTEYYNNKNNNNLIYKVFDLMNKTRLYLKGVRLGFSIPTNVFGPGLAIAHIGTIVVNKNATVGYNCRIHEGVTIGANGYGVQRAPIIGNNVFIGSGAKIIGGIEIADGIAIGAGSIVVNSFVEENITIAGNPAKKVSNKGSSAHLIKATEIILKNSTSKKGVKN